MMQTFASDSFRKHTFHLFSSLGIRTGSWCAHKLQEVGVQACNIQQEMEGPFRYGTDSAKPLEVIIISNATGCLGQNLIEPGKMQKRTMQQ